jgi:hypothetical protein
MKKSKLYLVDDEICITFANVMTSHATHLNSAPGEVFELLSV